MSCVSMIDSKTSIGASFKQLTRRRASHCNLYVCVGCMLTRMQVEGGMLCRGTCDAVGPATFPGSQHNTHQVFDATVIVQQLHILWCGTKGGSSAEHNPCMMMPE